VSGRTSGRAFGGRQDARYATALVSSSAATVCNRSIDAEAICSSEAHWKRMYQCAAVRIPLGSFSNFVRMGEGLSPHRSSFLRLGFLPKLSGSVTHNRFKRYSPLRMSGETQVRFSGAPPGSRARQRTGGSIPTSVRSGRRFTLSGHIPVTGLQAPTESARLPASVKAPGRHSVDWSGGAEPASAADNDR